MILPGTRLRVLASGLVPGEVASYRAELVGKVDGADVRLELEATRIDDGVLAVPLGTGLTDALAAANGSFSGTLRIVRSAGDGTTADASRPVELALQGALTPTATALEGADGEALTPAVEGHALWLGDALVMRGEGLVLPGEGTALVRFDGGFTTLDGAETHAVEGLFVPGEVLADGAFADPATPLARTALRFALTPDVFGIRPGRFVGTLTLVNAHLDGRETSSAPLDPGPLELRPPVLSSVSPLAASRGQIIHVFGRGLVPSDGLAQTATVLLLEGVFTLHGGPSQTFDGVSAIVVYPDIDPSARHATAVLRVTAGADGTLSGLGANAGSFVGTLTPLVLAGPDAIEGAPMPFEFRVRAPRQIVHIRFLPGFSDALVRFGLLAERGAIEARILAVLARDYAGYNVGFTYDQPTDFAEYTVVEVGGEDPNGTDLFGLDNTAGKDVGNRRFDDVIGGFNAETGAQNFAAYGGIFATEILNLSPTIGRSELSSPRFDDLFSVVVPELGGTPARLGESGGSGARAEAIAQAVLALGNILGSTITHEVAHSLGLTAIEGRYHNDGDTPNAIMDAGQFRPFEERAEIDGHGPAVFEPHNRDYLQRILPLDPEDP